ncbi:MAG: hypothetical protein M0C28_39235 [Candidatus Moduliflexus flocculans]|nr:hypothetical protein [Candidatus Moduliflexus flocculans]
MVGRGRLDRRLGHEHARRRLRRLRLHLAPRPGRRPQAGRDAQALPHRPDPDLAARPRAASGPWSSRTPPASSSPSRPTPTATTTPSSAT